MVFAGDIALPYRGAIRLPVLPHGLAQDCWYANLEGTPVRDGAPRQKRCVFNHVDALNEVCDWVRLWGVSLANNHVFDAGSFEDTERTLRSLGIEFGGAGVDARSAAEPILSTDTTPPVFVLAFGWKVIRCRTASSRGGGVNPLVEKHVLASFDAAASRHPAAKKVAFFHWGYELDNAPQPAHRDLAFRLIDAGADAVIGCHAHLAQGAEIYRGKPVVYGLGNFLFAQGEYHGGRLSFPPECSLELVFQTNFADTHLVHAFHYDRGERALSYGGVTELASSAIVAERTPFRGATSAEYAVWFECHRRKRRGLPIYYSSSAFLVNRVKDAWVASRDVAIRALVAAGVRW